MVGVSIGAITAALIAGNPPERRIERLHAFWNRISVGLSLRPNLWMLMLWMVTAAIWCGARLFRVKATSLPPTFWSNALVTMLILLGPAIEDAAVGKDVYAASAVRVCLFVAVALYAWATVWVLERWRSSGLRAPSLKRS